MITATTAAIITQLCLITINKHSEISKL